MTMVKMDKKKIIYGMIPLFLLVILGSFAFSFAPSIDSSNSVENSMERRGVVCVTTTGDFKGRETTPHVGFNEFVGCNDNLVVDQGLNATRDILGQGTIFGAFDVIGLCNSTSTSTCGAPVAGDSDIENEYTANGLSRAAGTYGEIALSAGNWTLFNTFTATGVPGIQTNKTCITNSTTVGNDMLLACNTFTEVTLDGTAGDQLTINWTNTVTSG